uniref:Uncharacterized protein n=1 Tax=Ananas comosus var. bracteatus TaxID=296719 RepID=A0A6V7PSJ7_ANACO|nr:unnamed protein product [Ananas comosus var. bracteatus]
MSSSSKARAEQAKARAEEKFRRRDVVGRERPPSTPSPSSPASPASPRPSRRTKSTSPPPRDASRPAPSTGTPSSTSRAMRRPTLSSGSSNACACSPTPTRTPPPRPTALSSSSWRLTRTSRPLSGRTGCYRRQQTTRRGGRTARTWGFSRPQPSTSASDSSGSTSTAAPAATAADDDGKIPARVVEIALTCPYCGSGSVRVAVNGDRVTATVPCQRCSRYFAVPENQRRRRE